MSAPLPPDLPPEKQQPQRQSGLGLGAQREEQFVADVVSTPRMHEAPQGSLPTAAETVTPSLFQRRSFVQDMSKRGAYDSAVRARPRVTPTPEPQAPTDGCATSLRL